VQYGKRNAPKNVPFGVRIEGNLLHPPLEAEGEWRSAYAVINFRDTEIACFKDYPHISRFFFA
jgi:hypothetical protein